MNKRGELSRIDRRIAEIKDGQLACYEAIENGRRQIENSGAAAMSGSDMTDRISLDNFMAMSQSDLAKHAIYLTFMLESEQKAGERYRGRIKQLEQEKADYRDRIKSAIGVDFGITATEIADFMAEYRL